MNRTRSESEKKYCQYGCGLSCPEQFLNFDASPTLLVQKVPFIGVFIARKIAVEFPRSVLYGNIVKGLPLNQNSMNGVYCSHTLEHLALADLRTALRNTYHILAPGGVFRCVLPDLEWACTEYIKQKRDQCPDAAIVFVRKLTMFGTEKRPRGILQHLRAIYGNSAHLWMWDYDALKQELMNAGFSNVRRAGLGDSSDPTFAFVEDSGRFENALAIECVK